MSKVDLASSGTAILGVLEAGRQAFNYFTQTSEYHPFELSSVPKSQEPNPIPISQMAFFRKFKKSIRRRFKKIRRVRGKTKVYKKRVSFKKRMKRIKRQARLLDTVERVTAPSVTRHAITTIQIASRPDSVAPDTQRHGNGRLWGYDVGECRTVNGPFNGRDDIFQAITDVTGITTTEDARNSDVKVLIEKCEATITARNNTNLGVRFTVYYVRPRHSVTGTTTALHSIRPRVLASMDTSISVSPVPAAVPPTASKPGANLQDSYMTPQTTLYEYNDVCTKFVLKKKKTFLFLPGQTLQFKVKSPVVGKARSCADLMHHQSNKNYHRAILFTMTGLPVHNTATAAYTEGDTTYGPCLIDFNVDHIVKYRKPPQDANNPQTTRDATNTTAPVILLTGQEIMPAVNPNNVTVQS